MNFQHEFSWMHFVNDNVSDTLLAITKFNQLIKINDAYSLGSTISTISDSLASDGVNNISAQNRNNNLYIGTGNTGLTQSKWFGRINRKQLGENINGQFLEPAELKSPDKFLKPPAPPPPDLSLPPPPPPAITAALTSLVPDCNVRHPVDVVAVTVSFPKEVMFLLPIIPPLVLGI